MNFQTSKNLGGIGAILMLIGVFPYINFYGIVELIGIILVLAALNGFADYFRERAIFNNALYGFIIAIIGAAIAAAIAVLIVLPNVTSFIMKLYPSWDGNLSTLPSLSNMTPDTSAIGVNDILPFVTAAITTLVIGWITAIVATFFFRRSFVLLTAKSTVGLFATSGLLLLIGAVLLVLFVLPGLVLMWVAVLLLAIAFFTMRQVQPAAPAAPVAAPPPPPTSI